jgi:hypothetical protein
MKRQLHLIAVAAIAGSIAAGAVQTLFSARADQFEIIPPTSGIYTGPQFSQLLGNANRSMASCNKGPTAPGVVAGAAIDGLCWIDDSASPWLIKRYVDGNWVVEGALDNVNGLYIAATGGGAASLASASTVDLGSVPQANVTITGATGVTNFGASAPLGAIKFLEFDNALVLTHSGNLIVPGGFPLTTAAGDNVTAKHLGLGVWKVTQYTRANGVPVDMSAVGEARHSFQEGTAAFYLPGDGRAILRASYPAYTAKMSRTQNGTRVSGNATITGIADTSKMGAGMPVESTGVNAGCTIASLVANTSITLNSSSCVKASGTSTVTVFLTGYGTGGDATKVGVPNCGGAVLAGRETSPSRLTSTYFGKDSSVMAVFGGSESHAQTVTEMAVHNHGTTVNSPNVTYKKPVVSASANMATNPGGPAGITGLSDQDTAASVSGLSVGTNNNGSGAAAPIVQPTLIADCNIRVIP